MSARHWSISSAANPEPPPATGEPTAAAGSRPTTDRRRRRAAQPGTRCGASRDVTRVIRTDPSRSRACAGRRATRTSSSSRPDFDDAAGLPELLDEEEGALVRDPSGLLHVVRDDHDRDVVRRARRSSPRRHGSRWGRAPSTARPSAAPAGAPPTRARCTAAAAGRPTATCPPSLSRSFTSFQRPARVRHSSTSASLSETLRARELEPGEHVVADRHRRERVRLLEHHADARPHLGRAQLPAVDVDAVELDPAGDLRARDHLVHPVQHAQERRLAAARRADERGDPLAAIVSEQRSSTLRAPNHALTLDGFEASAGFTRPLGVGTRQAPGASAIGVGDRGQRALPSLRSAPVCEMNRAVTNRTSTSITRTSSAGPRTRRSASSFGSRMSFHTNSGRSACGPVNGFVFVRVGTERGEQHRRGLADRRAIAEDRRGHQPGERGRDHDLQHDPPLRRAQRERTFAEVSRGSCAGSPRTHVSRSGASGRARATAPATPEKPWPVDPHGEDQQTGDDARETAHRVDDEPDRLREPPVDLVEVHGGEDARPGSRPPSRYRPARACR